jgi:hypothetical protein
METQAVSGSERFIATAFPPEQDKLLALSPRGTRLAVSYEFADFVEVFDTESGARVVRRKGFTRVSGVAFLSDEVLLVAAFGGCFRCNLPRGRRTLLAEEGWQACLTVSAGGGLVALGATAGIDLYDVRKGQVSHQLRAGFALQQYARGAAFSPDERYVAAELGNEADRQPTVVVVWDAQTGTRQCVLDTEAHALAFREDPPALAVADDHCGVVLYELGRGEAPAVKIRFDPPWRGEYGCALQFRAGGRALAVLLSSGDFFQVEPATVRVLRHRPPPPAPKPWGLRIVTSADWAVFAGPAPGGVVIWPGDRAEPGAAPDPAGR